MRVVAGKYGSRKLKAVPGKNTRPTTDKIKESMFNLLGGYFDGGSCLDLYAGSGALGIEAVSRGMHLAILCEKNSAAIQTIETNLSMTNEPSHFVLLKGNHRKTLPQFLAENTVSPFDLVLLDPPYHQQKTAEDIKWLLDLKCIDEKTTLLCETSHEDTLPDLMHGYVVEKFKNYGQTNISIYRKEEDVNE